MTSYGLLCRAGLFPSQSSSGTRTARGVLSRSACLPLATGPPLGALALAEAAPHALEPGNAQGWE